MPSIKLDALVKRLQDIEARLEELYKGCRNYDHIAELESILLKLSLTIKTIRYCIKPDGPSAPTLRVAKA
jgi:hypothetical protein